MLKWTLIVSLILSTPCFASTPAYITKLKNGQPVNIAVIGASIANGAYPLGAQSGNYDYASPGSYPNLTDGRDNPANPSYLNMLREWLQAQNPSSNVINWGICASNANWHVNIGQTVSKIIALGNVDVCIISTVINDVMGDAFVSSQTVTQYKADMNTMISQLRAAGIYVILMNENAGNNKFSAISPVTIPPDTETLAQTMTSPTWQNYYYVMVERFFPAINEIANTYSPALPVIDVWTPFNTMFESVGFANSYLIYMDYSYNIHPSNTGHMLIFNTLVNYFNTLTGTSQNVHFLTTPGTYSYTLAAASTFHIFQLAAGGGGAIQKGTAANAGSVSSISVNGVQIANATGGHGATCDSEDNGIAGVDGSASFSGSWKTNPVIAAVDNVGPDTIQSSPWSAQGGRGGALLNGVYNVPAGATVTIVIGSGGASNDGNSNGGPGVAYLSWNGEAGKVPVTRASGVPLTRGAGVPVVR